MEVVTSSESLPNTIDNNKDENSNNDSSNNNNSENIVSEDKLEKEDYSNSPHFNTSVELLLNKNSAVSHFPREIIEKIVLTISR